MMPLNKTGESAEIDLECEIYLGDLECEIYLGDLECEMTVRLSAKNS